MILTTRKLMFMAQFKFFKTFDLLNTTYEPSYSQYHWQVPVPKEVRLVSPSELQQAAAPEDNEASRSPTPPYQGGEEGRGECLTPVQE